MNELFRQYLNSWNYDIKGAIFPEKENRLMFFVQVGKRRHYRVIVSYADELPRIDEVRGTKTFDKECAIAIANKMMEVQFDWLRFLHNLPDEEDDMDSETEWDDL